MKNSILKKFSFILAVASMSGFNVYSQVAIRSDGVVQINGNSFFPYGFYTDEKDNKQAIYNHVSITGKAGFNVIHLESNDNDPLNSIFTEAAANKQYVIYGPAKYIGLQDLHAVYDKIKHQPALLGYNIGDDVNDGPMYGYPSDVSDVKQLHDDLKIYDPKHITMVALGGSGGQTEVFNARRFDASAQEIYPINGGSPINLVYRSSLEVVKNSLKWNQSPWGALQTFSWDGNPEQRMPNFKEYYNMLYQSIVAGVKGVLLYSYHVENEGVDSDINLWNGIKLTVPEINKIKNFLTEGKITKTELGTGLYAATWEYQNQVLAIVVHAGDYKSYLNPATNPVDSRRVSLALPSGTLGKLQSAFTNRPTGMSVIKGKLEGSIDLLDVHAYIIDKDVE